jgi:lipopolysaccharide/colanic/teichoic acid biosynthesis glycosyltransferase
MKPKALRDYLSHEDGLDRESGSTLKNSAQILQLSAFRNDPIPQLTWRVSLFFACKRITDITGALGLLFVLTPLLCCLALAVKITSPGPILFRQLRYGHHNALFTIYKFRTMRIDTQDISGVQQAYENDPRLTSIGGFMRRSSLDELPQILNVLKGDMSLVGPRPHVPGMLAGGMLYEDLVPFYFERHRVKPGVTGLAQINGLRGPTTQSHLARSRIEQDLQYIKTLSLKQDFVILWKTFVSELFGRNHGL